MASQLTALGLSFLLLSACGNRDPSVLDATTVEEIGSDLEHSSTEVSTTSSSTPVTSESSTEAPSSSRAPDIDPLIALPSEVLVVPDGLAMESGTSGILANIGGCVGLKSALDLPGGTPVIFEAGDASLEVSVEGSEIVVAGRQLKLGEMVWLTGGSIASDGRLTVPLTGECADATRVWFASKYCDAESVDLETGLCSD